MKRSKKTFILAAVLVLLLAGAGLLYNKLSQGSSPGLPPPRRAAPSPLLPFPLRTRKGIYWICPT